MKEKAARRVEHRRQQLLDWLVEHPNATTHEIGSLPFYARYSDAHANDLASLQREGRVQSTGHHGTRVARWKVTVQGLATLTGDHGKP